MFCDLVGSTSLSTRFDPEDLRELIGAYHHTVAATVAGFDGFVAKYMGDGVLIYFGYPHANEDDAERAVRAGLGVIDAVARLNVKSVKLQARVGIATGLVVVGDLIGEGSAQERSVVGEIPNLAARLQNWTEPDTVVIAAGTHRLVGDLFEYRDLGAVEVKGIATPVPVWQVLRQSLLDQNSLQKAAAEEIQCQHALRGCDIGLHERGRGRGSKQSGFSGFVRLYRGAVLPPDERADDRQVREIEHDASGERRGVKADGVVNRASEPAPKRHS